MSKPNRTRRMARPALGTASVNVEPSPVNGPDLTWQQLSESASST